MGVVFLGGLGPLTPKNNGWCCDRDEGGVNRVRGSVYRWLGVPYNCHRGRRNTISFCLPLFIVTFSMSVVRNTNVCVYRVSFRNYNRILILSVGFTPPAFNKKFCTQFKLRQGLCIVGGAASHRPRPLVLYAAAHSHAS